MNETSQPLQHVPDVISSSMPLNDVIERLVYHGCPNISTYLKTSQCGEIAFSRGGFGDVYRGTLLDGTKVALKCLRLYVCESEANRKALKYAARELHTWSKCRHPNIVELLGLVEFRGQIAMVSPWMENGSIDRLSSNSSINRYQLCLEIARGLAYLHGIGITHGDIKGANVLLSNNNVAQLADFGNAVLGSSILAFTESSAKSGHSTRWAAPEQLRDEVVNSQQADIYSLGMTILETISCQLPYAEIKNEAAVVMAITKQQHPRRPESTIPTGSKRGDDLWSLLKQCWSWDPKDRPEALFVVRVIETINSEDLLAEPEPNTMAPPYWTSRVSGTRAVSEITGTLEISGVSDLQRQQQSKLETVDEPMQLVPLSARLRLLRSAGYMQEQDNEAESISSERARVYESKVQQLMWKLDPKQIQTNIAGNVRGGTLPALVERLTMHGEFEETFIDSFLMTYKSFVTIEELFRLLVERYRISPPEGLTPQELEEWTEKKQKLVRVKVVDIFRKMLLGPSAIDKEDSPIMDHIKAFAVEVMNDVPHAKQLIVLVDRFTSGEIATPKFRVITQEAPPLPILPRAGKRLKLLDIDTLELARQLTILESRQYNAIKPTECLARARDEPAENDSIKTTITTANKIARWVACSVLEKEDPRRRAAIIKHFIIVAERCRSLHNYSSMAALIAGLNSPCVRRLKRTWDGVHTRWTSMLDDLESTLDSGKNFAGYKQRLKQVDAPCVPFFGVYLTVLAFIQSRNKDFLSKEDGIINFGKRQKMAEVIREIQGYQAKQYNLTPVDQIQAFIEQSLAFIDEKADYWDWSEKVEPREREDEKMTQMLQESGFL